MTGAAEHEALDSSARDAQVARDTFDQMPAMMISLSGPPYRICAANAALRDFLGRSDLIGLPLGAVLPELAGQQILELLDRVRETSIAATGHEWRVELEQRPGPGRDIYLDFTVLPWRTADGSIQGVLASGTDVTARVTQRLAGDQSAAVAERRSQAAHDLTASLQKAVLPTSVPVLPQARIAATYLIAGSADSAGGDWFDAIPLRAGSVALVVGDVVGHGVSAAAAMARLRAVLTELLIAERDAGPALQRLDAFAAREPTLRGTTLALAIVHPGTGAFQYATCGHPPPLIIDATGATRYLDRTGGGPLGFGSQQPLRAGTLGLADVIFLYSDGLIERPGRTLAESFSQLELVAGDAAAGRLRPPVAGSGAAERTCRLTVEILSRTGYADDVATLALERLAVRVPDVHLTVSSEVSSLRVLRRALTDWIAPLQPGPDDFDAVHMAVVEIVTNAIEHAYRDARPGPIDFSLGLTESGEVECNVTDYGTWRPPTLAELDRGNGLMLARHLVDQLQVMHPRSVPGAASGTPGTVVTLRQRLMSPVILAPDASTQPGVFSDDPHFRVVVPQRARDAARALVHGAIDMTTADQLLRRLLAVCKGGTVPLTVDLTGATRLASAGVGALFELSRQLRLHQHSLALVASADSQVQQVLDLVRLPHTCHAG